MIVPTSLNQLLIGIEQHSFQIVSVPYICLGVNVGKIAFKN